MAHHDAAGQAQLAVHLVELRLARLLHHGLERRQGDLGVIGRMRVAPRQLDVGVFEIREVRVDRARVRPHGGDRLVPGRVPYDGKRQPSLARPGDGRARLGSVMRRRDEVDVERALLLQLQAHLAQALDAHLRARLARGDHRVLAVDTAQRAVREEHSAAAARPADGRLLPEMQRRTRHHEAPVGPASPALPRRPIDPARAGAEIAC